jgi:hypothetical protein
LLKLGISWIEDSKGNSTHALPFLAPLSSREAASFPPLSCSD